MKRRLLFLVGLTYLPSLAWATPQCVSGTLASYIALGSSGCSVGSVTFANFAYAAKATGGAQQIPPDQIKVNPVFQVPSSAGLNFSAKWQAGSGQTQDSFFKYTVRVVSMSNNSGIATLQLESFQTGTFGVIDVRETADFGDMEVFANCLEVCTSRKTDTLQFWPVAPLRVVHHVNLMSRNGKTSLRSFNAIVDLCPLCV